MPDILHLVRIGVAPERVYDALTTAAGIRSWWAADVHLDTVVDGIGEFRFYGGAKATRVRIASLEPGVAVEWAVTASFRPEWLGTAIAFDLERTREGTTVRFAHRGFPRPDDDYALCTTGWGIYLGRLKTTLEAGTTAAQIG